MSLDQLRGFHTRLKIQLLSTYRTSCFNSSDVANWSNDVGMSGDGKNGKAIKALTYLYSAPRLL